MDGRDVLTPAPVDDLVGGEGRPSATLVRPAPPEGGTKDGDTDRVRPEEGAGRRRQTLRAEKGGPQTDTLACRPQAVMVFPRLAVTVGVHRGLKGSIGLDGPPPVADRPPIYDAVTPLVQGGVFPPATASSHHFFGVVTSVISFSGLNIAENRFVETRKNDPEHVVGETFSLE